MSSKHTLKNQKIYYICSGTTTNDIIDSINNKVSNKKKSFYDFFFSKKEDVMNKKIVKDQFAQLDELGIKEMYLCQENETFKNTMNNMATGGVDISIYTSLDYSCIESATILFHDYKLKIIPLLNMSDNTNIKDKKTFDIFKKKFGNYKITNDIVQESNIENYWNKKTNDLNDYIDLKKINATIDWSKTYTINISSLSNLNYSKFKNFFEEKCMEKYKEDSDISKNIDNFIFITDYNLIKNVLKETRKIKFDTKKDVIERSSVWEMDINIYFEYDTPGKITKKRIEYNRFTKIYPTNHNHSPLKYIYNNNTDKYEYEYNYYKFILFNSLNRIPIKYIEKLYFYRYSSNKKTLIRKILNINNKRINNKNKNINNKNNKIITVKFDELK